MYVYDELKEILLRFFRAFVRTENWEVMHSELSLKQYFREPHFSTSTNRSNGKII